ncbi:amino acid-binding ACT protein [Desulfocurvibacter africanus]|uniref:Amino acid-binding ACT domain protein n=1 Tax=Desulfocurvibacter africanus subsp. africanus str. Walvis Bay TaxID=690850 RepID=F3Z473_DESAF|nr:amino acid-binding ACT protein [Desulfocurvibacter africanus]EGJ51615.1 amino acid-binding ACT domain protein [Desulfocurvibacter africanus subsp. africanus str. Walvis Bay]
MHIDAPKAASPQGVREGEGAAPGGQAGAAGISQALSEPIGQGKAVLELRVAGHSGSLPQVCGLLARRAFPVEAMLCLPASGGWQSIWLLVPEDGRLGQLMRQVGKLGDVLGVHRRDGLGPFETLMAP